MQKLTKYTIDEMIKKYYKNETDITSLIEDFSYSTLVLTREEFKEFEKTLTKLLVAYNKLQDGQCFSYNFNAIEDDGTHEDEELIEIDLLINYKKEETYNIEVELLDEYVSTSDDFVKLYNELKNGTITLSEFCEKYILKNISSQNNLEILLSLIFTKSSKNIIKTMKLNLFTQKNGVQRYSYTTIFLYEHIDNLVTHDYRMYLNIV